MNRVLDPAALDQIFRSARTHNVFLERPVADEQLRELYELLKWGPTSANCSPARFVFLRTHEAKERLRPALAPGNLEKTLKAPVTAIVATDYEFYEKLPQLLPRNPRAIDWFKGNSALVDGTAFRNGTLQGAYLIVAARAASASTAGPCRASTTPRSMRSSSAGIEHDAFEFLVQPRNGRPREALSPEPAADVRGRLPSPVAR